MRNGRIGEVKKVRKKRWGRGVEKGERGGKKEEEEPPILWVPGVKRPGHEADHSPPTSAEVKNT
jgi:hypothetical protein